MKLSEAVAKRIEKFLVEQGMSTYRLSRKSGVTAQAIQLLLSRQNKDVRLSTLIMLAHGFGITIEELIGQGNFDYDKLEFDKF